MSHARLTHPSRPTLEFRQGQTDSDQRQAVTNVANQIGSDLPTLVHIQTKEGERQIDGRVTAPRRARNDGSTSDWQQALANYVDLLEAHCDEFQGLGYTLVDDVRSTSKRVIYESVEWSIGQGRPFDLEYTCNFKIGRGTLDEKAIERRNPTVNSGMSVAATVDGNDLPGLREMRVRREVGIDVRAIYDADNAENNDAIAEAGEQQQITFRGTHTGSDATRAAADSTLEALLGAGQVTFTTRFPGYAVDGFVTGYDSDLESRFGANSHHFSLQFIIGDRL